MRPKLTEDELMKVLNIAATYSPCCPDDAQTPCSTCFLMNAAMSLVYEVESRRRHEPTPAVERVLRIRDADAGIADSEAEIRPRSATGTVVQNAEDVGETKIQRPPCPTTA